MGVKQFRKNIIFDTRPDLTVGYTSTRQYFIWLLQANLNLFNINLVINYNLNNSISGNKV